MNIDTVLNLNAIINRNRGVRQKTQRVRLEPEKSLSDNEFKRTYRFSKGSVERITQILGHDLQVQNQQGLPISPLQQVCIALNHFGGGQFQRISGQCGGVSQFGARISLVRVTDALVDKKPDYIKMPGPHESADTANRMFAKFKLPRFAYAIDGTLMAFPEAPRGLPENKTKQQFWSRKQRYGINVQVVSNDRRIYDLDVGWPGGTHDARIYARSEVKHYLETEAPPYYLAGDSAYPISELLQKPYPVDEAHNDRRKRLFNKRLSGLRTLMSECIYGRWKRRFPVVKALRTHLEFSQKTIVATAILFNLARDFDDEDLEEEDDEDSDDEEEDDEQGLRDGVGTSEIATRLRGQLEREKLLRQMDD